MELIIAGVLVLVAAAAAAPLHPIVGAASNYKPVTYRVLPTGNYVADSPTRSYSIENMNYVVPNTKYYDYGNVIPILKSNYHSNNKGNYQFEYETGNGIEHKETGKLKDEKTIAKTGAFSYESPEGQTVALNYVADEHGFRVSGDHVPTPPPIPAAIVRSLEYNRLHGSGDEQGQYHPERYGGDDGQYRPELYSGDDGQYRATVRYTPQVRVSNNVGLTQHYEPVVSSQFLVPSYVIPNQYYLQNQQLLLNNRYLSPTSQYLPLF